MVENLGVASPETTGIVKPDNYKPRITVFHCFNAVENLADIVKIDCDIKEIQMPCSSMTKEVFLLRAFESGADAVVVIVCPQGTCRYIEGNIRAGKRVARVKKLLDEIGLDSQRLNIFFIPPGDNSALNDAINQTINSLFVAELVTA
jgi:F420-non-reducing hydrogenase iron-sulfur subunit